MILFGFNAVLLQANTEDYYTVNFDFVAQETNQITCLKGDKVKFVYLLLNQITCLKGDKVILVHLLLNQL